MPSREVLERLEAVAETAREHYEALRQLRLAMNNPNNRGLGVAVQGVLEDEEERLNGHVAYYVSLVSSYRS